MRFCWAVVITAGWFLISCRGCESKTESSSTDQSIAACMSAVGDVRMRAERDVAWSALEIGTKLDDGDWVQTAERSSCEIAFHSGEILRIQPASIMVVRGADAQQEKPKRIVVRKGTIRGAVASRKSVVFETPGGAPLVLEAGEGASSANYRVAVGEDGRLEVAVTKGKVRLTDRTGRRRVVSAGQAVDVLDGQASDVVAVLPPFPESLSPGVDAVLSFAKGQAVRLVWSEVSKAARYQVEVAHDISFHQLVHAVEVDETTWSLLPDEPGLYCWRISSIGPDGRRGEPGFARRIRVVTGPVGSLLVAPPDGTVFERAKKTSRIDFSWKATDPPTPYTFVLSTQSDLTSDVVAKEKVIGQSIRLNAPEIGTYYWGVFGGPDDTLRPLFTVPFELTVKQEARGIQDTEVIWE